LVALNQLIEAHTSKPHAAGAEVSNASHHPSIPGLATMPSETVSSKCDHRIDVLRGMALLMIFVDHIPGNVLSLVTLHNFGFSDAAEVFVLLAGIDAGLW
jgi:uncharacterized membrane protein